MSRKDRFHELVKQALIQTGWKITDDPVNDQCLLFRTGWDNQKWIHNCIFHFDIKDDKIWIQENNTDIEVDKELEEMGISKKEIVVGFHHPSMREYSEYAVC